MIRAGSQQVMKDMNKSLLLHLIYQHGPISRIELARLTKLSPTTVSVLIEEHIHEGIVHEVGTSGSGVGRKMTMLRINAKHGYILGVDLSNSPGSIVLFDMQGQIAATYEFVHLVGEVKIIQHLPEMIHSFIAEQKLSMNQIGSIGLSVPGIIDEERKVVLRSNALKLEKSQLKDMIEKTVGIHIHLVNDIDAAGFAERYSGAAKGLETVLFMLVGYGVGAGLVIHDQIFKGNSRQAGRCDDLIPYNAITFSRRLLKEYPHHFSNDLNPDAIIQLFLQKGSEGADEAIKKEWDHALHTIAKYCGILLQFLNPEKLILNGWIIKNEAFFRELSQLIHHYEASPLPSTPVEASHWKELGPAVGAGTIGLHEIFKMKTVN